MQSLPITGGTPTVLDTYSNVNFLQYEITPDSSKVLYSYNAGPQSDNLTVTVVPVAGGTTSTLAANVSHWQITPDSAKVVYMDNFNPLSRIGDLKVVPIAGGTPVTLAITIKEWNWQIAPDGSKVIYNDSANNLSAIPITGGTPTLLDTDVPGYVIITPDGSKVIYPRIFTYPTGVPSATTRDLKVISITGGIPVTLANDDKYGCGFEFSPDGSKIIYGGNYNSSTYTGDLKVVLITGGIPVTIATGVDYIIAVVP